MVRNNWCDDTLEPTPTAQHAVYKQPMQTPMIGRILAITSIFE